MASIVSAVAWIQAGAIQAQQSPNCLRNRKPDICAVTPMTAASNQRQTTERITFADHSVYEVVRDERSCKRESERIILCRATIRTPPGNPKPQRARYRGSAYEGGYRHDFSSPTISITYFILD